MLLSVIAEKTSFSLGRIQIFRTKAGVTSLRGESQISIRISTVTLLEGETDYIKENIWEQNISLEILTLVLVSMLEAEH